VDALLRLLDPLQSWLFQAAVQPALYRLGLMGYADAAYDATGAFVTGLAEIGLVYALLRPLEAIMPIERWRDRRGVRVDVLYTFLKRSGALPLLFFLFLDPLLYPTEKVLRAAGYLPPNLEDWVPWLQSSPLAAFLAYAAVIDFTEYWRHRLSHRFVWWWALHAVHHSQRRLSFWADDRNHLLDDLTQTLWFVTVAQFIGVPGAQFVALVVARRLIESLSHANVRLGFGALGERLVVSPRFHRLHHAMGVGHEGKRFGCNFATLFPVWDVLFGTANFARSAPPTGIRDQLEGADYGTGFVAQQLRGLARLWRALRPGRPREA
jgi:sterol desaturase/sphingolipid hydroxylase (fatty acid hydroxylase superfamily)